MFYQQYFYPLFKRLTLFFVLFSCVSFHISGQSTANAQSKNFVRESSFQQSGTVVSTEYNNPSKVQHKITYFDGLGRPIQTVLPAQGALGQDIITAIEYDAYGRPSKSYLPYPKTSGTGDLDASFSNNATSFYGGDIRSFSESVYENSPLNRVVKQAGAGSGWDFNSSPTAFDDRTVKVKTFANVANDVMLFTVSNIDGAGNSFGASSTPVNAGGFAQNSFYAANTLLVTETLDENNTTGTNGGRSREYKDRSGKVILKRNYDGSNALDTYYVYDDFGQLRGVFPPKLSKLFSNGTSANNLAIAFNQLGFIYCYDDQGRLVKKKVPDAGWVSMTYTSTDLLDTQTDAKGTVSYFLYDNLNRVKETGVNNQWLVKNYYDGVRPASLPSLANPYNNIATDIEKGQLTGSETRILNTDGSISASILKMAVYFDSRSRAVRTYNESFDGSSVVSTTSYLKLHYTGRVEESITEQKVSSSLTLKTLEAYSYDHVGRLISTCQTLSELNGSGVVTYTEAPRLLQCQSYDAIGRLTTKKLGRLPAASLTNQSTKEFAEVLTYGYNIRSWATSIVGYQKPDKSNNATGTKNFDFSLMYNDASQYNGNIGKLKWNGSESTFAYDGLNRLKSSTGQHSEVLTYDENGNINTLNRNLSGVEADGLTYSYSNYTNKLLSVSDSKSGTLGYKSPNGGNDFVYDNNGNLTSDADKGIGINYNVLNLVRQVTGNTSQSYLYDGSGAKLAQHNGTSWKAYIGTGEYVGGKLYRMATSEGYIMPNPNYVAGSTVGKYNYFYSLKDHLGNVRAVVVDDANATQVQTNDYTAFGVAISSDVSKNKYLYNDKELQDGTNWLDYGARMYQPEIGRWMAVDPMAELNPELTPYRYAFNNPVRFTDFMGLWEKDKNGNYTTDDKQDITRFLNYVQAETVIGHTPSSSDMNNFISHEYYDGGSGRTHLLSDGSTLQVAGITVMGRFENNKWKTKNVEYPFLYTTEVFNKWSQGSLFASFGLDQLKSLNTFPADMWMGKNGKLYPSSWGGNGATGSRVISIAKTAKALKTLRILGGSLLFADGLMKAAELEYNGLSNRSLAKVGVAVGITALAIATGGIGGVVVGVALNALDTYGGFDGFYQQFSNDPRYSSYLNTNY